MGQYIDKSALVAEIERRIRELEPFRTEDNLRAHGAITGYYQVLSFIDTIEVKEVDLDFQMFAKEMNTVFNLPSSETENTEENPLNWEFAIAKHFFELGMQQSKKDYNNEDN